MFYVYVYVLLLSCICWLVAGTVRPGSSASAAAQLSLFAFFLFAFIQSLIRSAIAHGQSPVAPERAAEPDLPAVRLKETLLVDDQLGTAIVNDAIEAEGDGQAESHAVRQLYQTLDD